MSASDSINLVKTGPYAVSTFKWISVRLVLPIVVCGTVAVALQTTFAEGPKLAAANLPQLASLTPDATSPEAAPETAPVAPPRPSALPGNTTSQSPTHGPGDARNQAAAAMLLLLVAASKKRGGGEAQRQAAAADLPVRRQTADARQVR